MNAKAQTALQPWMICPTCHGDGRHSRALGVVDPHDFSPDEWDRYLDGGFNQTCSTCEGTGKVRRNEGIERHERLLDFERLGPDHFTELRT